MAKAFCRADASQDYAEAAESFAEVHSQIRACDAVLEQMESLLSGFQGHLGTISSEIRHLQEESTALSVKLANRQAVSSRVTDFVQSAVIPEAMAREICEAEVGEAYLEYLVELDKRTQFVAAQSKGGRTPPLAVTEVAPVLQRLQSRAVGKVREYLLQRIHALKKPRTNLQMIQHNVLSKLKYMNVFLQSHAPAVFEEVQALYVEVLSKLYAAFFKAYLTGLTKLESVTATRYDLLGIEPEKQKSWTDKFTTARPGGNAFALGGRAAVLANMDADLIVPHEAAEKNARFPYDALFRSLNHYLLDSVTSEWLFCMEWFGPNDLFNKIFTVPLQQCLQTVAATVRGSFDCIGLLIMLRITALNKLTMVRRGIPVLVPYFQKLDTLLLPRLLEVLQLNAASVQAFQVAPGSVELRPHFIVRRYAEVLTALSVLTRDFAHPDVLAAMAGLRDAVLALLERLGQNVALPASAGAAERERRKCVFMITNLDLLLGLAREKEALPPTETVVLMEEKMEQAIGGFVRDQLGAHFGPLFSFVQKGGAADKEAAEALVRGVHKSWKEGVAKVCQSVTAQNGGGFSNFSLAGAVCRKMLLELTKCNTRCWDLIKEAFGPNAFSKFCVAPFQLRDEFAAAMKSVGLILEI